MAKKGNRVQVILECTEHKESGMPGMSRYITTKNNTKQNKFKKNYEYVAEKIKQVEEKDKVRNFQPPITGEEIMALFNLKPSREIGILKEKVKEAILEGEIENNHEQAKNFVIQEAKKLGL